MKGPGWGFLFLGEGHSVLREQIAQVIGAMQYEFVGCEEAMAGRQTVLRIYIDHAKGVTVEDCAKVSRQVSAMLAVTMPDSSRYSLEVSSPGIERPLFEIAHYQKHIGRRVRIQLAAAIQNRKRYIGRLEKVEGETIYLLVDDDETVMLPWSAIAKANVIE
jgi:ribosome maturation factor RimP